MPSNSSVWLGSQSGLCERWFLWVTGFGLALPIHCCYLVCRASLCTSSMRCYAPTSCSECCWRMPSIVLLCAGLCCSRCFSICSVFCRFPCYQYILLPLTDREVTTTWCMRACEPSGCGIGSAAPPDSMPAQQHQCHTDVQDWHSSS